MPGRWHERNHLRVYPGEPTLDSDSDRDGNRLRPGMHTVSPQPEETRSVGNSVRTAVCQGVFTHSIEHRMQEQSSLTASLHEFRRLKNLADRAIGQLTDEQLFIGTGAEDNSIAVIMKHLAGNMRSRWRDFLTSDGEKPDRNRDGEFVITPEDTAIALRKRWDEGWGFLFDALSPLQPPDLQGTVTIRGEPLSIHEAITRQVSHYAYHVGQIVFLAKHIVGTEWKSLSIPKGQSDGFNRNPEKYRNRS
jgi:Protein of unknown function (DUF1572)